MKSDADAVVLQALDTSEMGRLPTPNRTNVLSEISGRETLPTTDCSTLALGEPKRLLTVRGTPKQQDRTVYGSARGEFRLFFLSSYNLHKGTIRLQTRLGLQRRFGDKNACRQKCLYLSGLSSNTGLQFLP